MTENFLDGLSPIQREAASNINGASLIIAGAGSGKTRTLTYRIAHMIQSGIPPYNILSLTFTNKAAREMRERITQLLPPAMLRGLWMGTFHGVFRRIISREAHLIGYPENFTLYDTADSANLVKAIVKELGLPDDKYKPRDVFSRISLAKNNLITAAAYEANAGARSEDEEARRPEIYRIYSLYTKRCRANKAMDFDDLLLIMFYLLKNFPEVVDKYSELFKYILVDEYQDTNHVQYMILRTLAQKYGNVCVVGDDSQSIYSFRGARIENILRFEKDFPEAKVFKLEQNYRSTKTIVEASNSLIEHNSARLKKKLFSGGEQGDKIRVFEAMSDKDEAARVVGDIASSIYRDDASPSDFAILYRTHSQSRVMEEKLREKGIDYKIHEGNSFYSRLEIKAMLAYLRLAVNPADNEALRRIINFPARGIGETSVLKIEAAATQLGVSMFEALRSSEPSALGIKGVAVGGIKRFVETFGEFAQVSQTMDAYEFASEVAQKSGLMALYRASGAVEDKSRLDNIEELLNSVKSFEMPDPDAEDGVRSDFTIAEWLSEVSLLGDNEKSGEDTTPRVTLMTVHASKGLEYKNIYIVGLEEKLFPSPRAMMSPVEIEEERRLFYVALTRAKRRATLSYALSRFQWGDIVDCTQSRFINEIDEKYIDSEATCTGGGGFFTPKPKSEPKGSWGGGYQKRAQRAAPAQRPSNSDWLNVNKKPNLKRVGSSMVQSGSVQGVEFAVGDKVSHQSFGGGVIVEVEKTPSDVKLTVEFNGIGSKTLLQRFARLVRL
ncbi:MAG: UvrD-helicase domain-containing protein [Rikenellaceae bacterium]